MTTRAPRLRLVLLVPLLVAACVGDRSGDGVSADRPGADGAAAPDAGGAAGEAAEAGSTPGAAASAEGDGVDAADADTPGDAELDAPPLTETGRRALVAEAGRVLDDWHQAASVGARDRYLGHFSPDAVFLGTDPGERWDLAEFTAYVDRYFRPGRGWTYVASDRHVVMGPEADVAWFDERLTSGKYGSLRGTGALRRVGESWRIAQYSMTFTIPNDAMPFVLDALAEADEAR